MMTFNVDDFLGGYRPPKLSIQITSRADLLAELTARVAEVDRVESSGRLNDARVGELRGEIEALVGEIQASEVSFEFEAVGSQAYQRLIDAHPPLPAEKESGAIVRMVSFAPALVSACASNPQIDLQQAEAMRDTLTQSQWEKLVGAAMAVNVGDDTAPKWRRSSVPEDEGQGLSDTPLSTVSPEVDSSDVS